jgi:hypothetical protein
MAHKITAESPANPTTATKIEPSLYLSLPSEVRVSGLEGLGLKKRVRVTVEGTCTGFSIRDSGSSVDIKPSTIKIEGLGDAGGADDDTPSMASLLTKTRAGRKG